jgi:hypothetical protein
LAQGERLLDEMIEEYLGKGPADTERAELQEELAKRFYEAGMLESPADRDAFARGGAGELLRREGWGEPSRREWPAGWYDRRDQNSKPPVLPPDAIIDLPPQEPEPEPGRLLLEGFVRELPKGKPYRFVLLDALPGWSDDAVRTLFVGKKDLTIDTGLHQQFVDFVTGYEGLFGYMACSSCRSVYWRDDAYSVGVAEQRLRHWGQELSDLLTLEEMRRDQMDGEDAEGRGAVLIETQHGILHGGFLPLTSVLRPWGDLEARMPTDRLLLERVKTIAAVLGSDDSNAVAFRGAVRCLNDARGGADWNHRRAFCLAQAVEILFPSKSDSRERTMAFAEAVAQRLSRSRKQRDERRKTARNLYKMRSEYLHTGVNGRPSPNPDLDDLLARVVSLVRDEFRALARDLTTT